MTTPTDAELINNLKKLAKLAALDGAGMRAQIEREAADRLAALAAERDKLKEALSALSGTCGKLNRQLLDAQAERDHWRNNFDSVSYERDRYRAAINKAAGELIELNLNNYTDDDVCEANNAAIAAMMILDEALKEPADAN